jgi:hypothetical protein
MLGVLIVIAIGALIAMHHKPIHNEGTVGEQVVRKINTVDDQMEADVAEENKEHPIDPATEQVDAETQQKFQWKNQLGGVENNYKDGKRGVVDPSEWDQYYRLNAGQIEDSFNRSNDEFKGIDESGGKLAHYADAGMRKKQSPEELFKVDELLPQEVNKNWFEVMPEPIKIKNRHLINVTRPVGVNTIGTSLKNASYDIRGTPPCPKFVLSPWLQSSIEPDINIKGLC